MLHIEQSLLTPNPYSRPQLPLRSIRKLVIHWVANPATSALANRNYFENLKHGTRGTYASSHYIVGLEGEILQCVPDAEVAYHAKNANQYSLGIEVCHPDWDGEFDPITYKSLIALLAHLCITYTLDPASDLLRHYDITGKVCPRFYVHHPAHWTLLKADVMHAVNEVYFASEPVTPHQPMLTPIEINGHVKNISAFRHQDEYYIHLRDLANERITVDYDDVRRMPIVKVQ